MDSLLNPFRRGEKGVLTLSIEGSSLRLLRSDNGRVLSWMTLPFNPRLMRDGRVEDSAALAEVIKNGLGRLEGGGGKLMAAFPGTRLTIRVLGIPRVRGITPETVVPREARRILGPAADQQFIFWTPVGGSPVEMRFFLLALPRNELSRFFETLNLAGLKPRKVDARPLALARAVDIPSAVLLRLEASDLDVTVMVDKVPQLVTRRALEVGTTTEDLFAEITEAIQTTVTFLANRADGASLPSEAPVLLFGGHPYLDDGFISAIQESIGREVRFPTCPLSAPPDFPFLEYMVNIGLALKKA